MEQPKPQVQDISHINRSNEIAHWRGFTKYLQPDGMVWAVYETEPGKGIALGPCGDGKEADAAIWNFYTR